MDDKIFQLLEKMYNEMQTGFKQVRQEMQGDIRQVRQELCGEMQTGFEQVRQEIKEVKQDAVRFEDKMDNHMKALYDGYKQNTEKLGELESKVGELSNKVERQEVEIRVIKGAK